MHLSYYFDSYTLNITYDLNKDKQTNRARITGELFA